MDPIRTAEILAVGTELLTPHRLDTNSLHLTGRLNDIGIDVRAKGVVGDDARELAVHLRHAIDRADLIVTTGGLGPTADDLTREVVADVLGLPLVEDASVLEAIRRRFEQRRLRMPEGNRRQAAVPRGARVLPNSKGTAPGLWIESAGRILVLLPGPPREMQPMFETAVLPHLAARSGGRRVVRRVVKVAGRAESQVEEIAQPIYAKLADGHVPVETTILASPGQIELHLSARGSDIASMEHALAAGVDALAAALAPAVFSIDGRSIEQVVGDALLARAWRLAVAESCTGGLVSGRLTDVAGSSAWFAGGVVAYANEIKILQLAVSAELIAEHGAVSEPVARAMAEGVRQRFGTDVGLSITGVAGPGGGSARRPVGSVVIGVSTGTPVAKTFALPGDRQMVRQRSVMAALELLRQALVESPTGSRST